MLGWIDVSVKGNACPPFTFYYLCFFFQGKKKTSLYASCSLLSLPFSTSIFSSNQNV